MKKYSLYFDERQMAVLKAVSKRTGVPVAELIRRAVAKEHKGTKQ